MEWRPRHYIKVTDYASKSVIKVLPADSLLDAANLMIRFKIRHLPVTDTEGRVIGLIGIRDVADALLKKGRERLEEEKVVDWMNDQPVKVSEDVSLHKAVELMLETGVGSIVITDDMDVIKGILSEKDVVKFLSVVPSIEAVANVASPISTYVLAGSSVREVLELMMELWSKHLVMSREGKVVGVISMLDLVKKALEDGLSAPADDAVKRTEVLPPEAPISLAAAIMVSKNKEALLVGRKEPDSIVTEKNMVRGALEVLSKL
ncbi:CBS domain-containing protein [Ignicoccus hospitalis]|uniref:Putative signal-transduction protein with CBS domains n=1 Tax=Ignicoccus hospitalis (strain KIN4/I / DSM 18386 / JCM 14125) TaxID=453591 RepID=A8A9S8_IGNH4|nr:CBS domain-containing protein [Ignicoccus hospitalis]ABU81680.1 putative signal-transduction protein with CBS domains [Ignicoccus hospitalis KIN4/I]HIH89797.1 CBS domain-containing protein [Desulfurococcaceae archaeon]